MTVHEVTAAPAPGPSGARAPARTAPTSLRRRRLTALVVVAVLLVLVSAASLGVGARSVPIGDVWSALWSPGQTQADLVVRSLRLPRTVIGLVVGGSLGLAGALVQGHTRNPLADPGLLGVSAGAAFAVVTGISVFGVTSSSGYVWFSFLGALLASAAVFGLGAASAGGRSGSTPLTLALAGTAISALLAALTSALVLLDPATLDAYRSWVVGSVAGRSYGVLLPVLPFLVMGAVFALAQGPSLNALGMGDDVAKGLGIRVGRVRLGGIVAITLLTGGAVAVCGPIAFVGLVVPHIARAVTGPDQRWLLPLAALGGAVLLVAADVVGRVVARPGELPVGVTLAFVGAPVFIALVRRRRLVSL